MSATTRASRFRLEHEVLEAVPDSESEFRDAIRERSQRGVVVTCWAIIAIIIVWAPLDIPIWQQDRELAVGLMTMRAGGIAVCLANVLLMRISAYRRRLLVVSTMPACLGGVIAATLAHFGEPTQPFMYGAYLIPFTTAMVLVNLRTRILITAIVTAPWAAMLLVVGSGHGYLYTAIPQFVVLTAYVSSLVIGELMFRFVVAQFVFARQLEGQTIALAETRDDLRDAAAELTTLNASLAGQVEHRTRDLRALTTRLRSDRADDRRRLANELEARLGEFVRGLRVRIDPNAEVGATPAELDLEVAEMVQTLRRTLTSLRPQVLNDLGLVPAIEWLAAETTRRTGIPVRVDVVGAEPQTDPERALGVFRIVQQAVDNAVRHSGSERVDVLISRASVTVADAGIGIRDLEDVQRSSLGMAMMRERALAIGAKLKVVSTPGEGTVVRLGLG